MITKINELIIINLQDAIQNRFVMIQGAKVLCCCCYGYKSKIRKSKWQVQLCITGLRITTRLQILGNLTNSRALCTGYDHHITVLSSVSFRFFALGLLHLHAGLDVELLMQISSIPCLSVESSATIKSCRSQVAWCLFTINYFMFGLSSVCLWLNAKH